jgi:hypothetical protein
MKANAGDSTVGVALEELALETGTINVLISRRNKSLTVEQVEEKITQNIAEMEIEDEVNLLVSNAVENLNLNDEVFEIIRPELALLDGRITVETDSLRNQIDSVDYLVSDLQSATDEFDLRISSIESSIAWFEEFASSTQATLLGLDTRITDLENTGLSIQEGLNNASSSIVLLQNEIENIYGILENNSASTTTQELAITQADIEIETLVVNEAATFYGTLYVQGEAGFMHKVTFEEDIEVKGKIYASSDQAGTVTIAANATSTEVVFNKEYEVVPKIAVSANINLLGNSFWIDQKTATGFRINLSEPTEFVSSFDWIALAVKGEEEPQGEPPIIDNVLISRTEVGLSEQVELWVIASDPDTNSAILNYSWSVSPNIGIFTANESYITNWSSDSALENTDLVFTITVSDGKNSITESRSIRLVINQNDEEDTSPVVILGCTDETATNYNPGATEDDGTCIPTETASNPEEEIPTEEIVLGPPSPPEENSVEAGCMDQTATKYDPNTTEDDGSCIYESLSQEEIPDDGVGGPE